MFKKSEKSAAPSLQNVKSKPTKTIQPNQPNNYVPTSGFKPIPKSSSQPEHKLPKIMLFGCGGCGTNLVQKFCSQFEDINSKIDKCVVFQFLIGKVKTICHFYRTMLLFL